MEAFESGVAGTRTGPGAPLVTHSRSFTKRAERRGGEGRGEREGWREGEGRGRKGREEGREGEVKKGERDIQREERKVR